MIEVVDLTKRFGKKTVFEKINLKFKEGAITALLGPNGVGKTTFVKCILGLVKPSEGYILIDGKKTDKDFTYRENIGYMSQNAEFPENLTAKDLKEMLIGIRKAKKRLDEELFELLNLAPYFDKPIKTLSGGTKQKVNAYLAFLFDPDILIADEPTAGLDLVSALRLKEKLIRQKQKGKTIIMPSHIVSEVEEISDDVVLMAENKIFLHGSVEEVKKVTNESKLDMAISKIITEEAYKNE